MIVRVPTTAKACIFCGESAPSTEKLWSGWTFKNLRKAVPDNQWHPVLDDHPDTPDDRRLAYSKIHNDDVPKLKIKAACGICNNGWISRLDEQVKPILVPLMKGESRVLTQADVSSIARWITLKVMLLEFAAPEAPVTCPEQHKELRSLLRIPAQWQISIAAHPGKRWRARSTRYGAYIVSKRDMAKIPQNLFTKNVQFILLGMDRLLFVVLCNNVPGKSILGLKIDTRVIRPLHPFVGNLVWPPTITLTDDDIDTYLTAGLIRCLQCL